MKGFFRYGFILLILFVLFPVNVRAGCRMWDAEAVVTVHDGLPCFSYPQDEVIRTRPFSFANLGISKTGPIGGAMWAAQISDSRRKGLLEPNSPKYCIKYGGPHPGIKDWNDPAKPLLMDTPYEIFMRVSTPEGPLYERKFHSFFCLTRDEKGNKIIVGAYIEDDPKYTVWKCLKPGEKPKRSFWQRLFGK